MYFLKKINLDEVWQKEQGWNEEKKSGRKYDDQKELDFWVKIAPHYSEEFNLYRDVKGLKEKIYSVINEKSTVLDLGCGTGNFSIPLSSHCSEILALDFSPAMLKELSLKMKDQNISNIRMIRSKWEDFSEPYDADYVLAVNSLYRVCNMRDALKKIVLYGRKGFIIVRTIFRPMMYSIYEDLNLNYKRNNDYMLIPLMLWDMGIHADVEFMKYSKLKKYHNLEAARNEMIQNLGNLTYLNFNTQLEEKFLKCAKEDKDGFIYLSERIVQVITYRK